LIKSAALVGAVTVATPAAPALAQKAAAADRQPNSNFRLYDPDKLPPSPGFSQVAEVTRGKLVYIAGQVPRNAAGELVGAGDFRAQLEQVFGNLDLAVRSAGATFADVIKLNYYCVASIEPAQQRAVVEVRDRYVNTQSPPVSTFVFVSRLVHPDWLIEIEAVAVLPAP
jgi:enamine deaminase RidA (YjgF/YER057c/UK114 family)